MVWIDEKKDIIKIEKIGRIGSNIEKNTFMTSLEAHRESKNTKDNIKYYKSKAKSVKGLILGLINKFRKDAKNNVVYTPFELQKIFEEAYNKFIELFPNKITEVNIFGWKGKNSYEIYKGVDNIFRIIEYRKSKDREINKKIYEVEPDKINYLLKIIQNLDINTHYPAKFFWEKIIKHYNLKVDIEAFNGGKYRAKYYFPYYYFPLKCIEASRIIKVIDGGGGGIIRLK